MRKLCGISSTQFDDCYALLSFAVNTAADALDALVFPQMLLHSRAEHAGSLAVYEEIVHALLREQEIAPKTFYTF